METMRGKLGTLLALSLLLGGPARAFGQSTSSPEEAEALILGALDASGGPLANVLASGPAHSPIASQLFREHLVGLKSCVGDVVDVALALEVGTGGEVVSVRQPRDQGVQDCLVRQARGWRFRGVAPGWQVVWLQLRSGAPDPANRGFVASVGGQLRSPWQPSQEDVLAAAGGVGVAARAAAQAYDPAHVTRAIAATPPQFLIRTCFSTELRRYRNLMGVVTVQFTATPQGRIADARVTDNTTLNPALARCLVSALETVRVNPAPPEPLAYSYPLVVMPENTPRGAPMAVFGVVSEERDSLDRRIHEEIYDRLGRAHAQLPRAYQSARARNASLGTTSIEIDVTLDPSGLAGYNNQVRLVRSTPDSELTRFTVAAALDAMRSPRFSFRPPEPRTYRIRYVFGPAPAQPPARR